MSKAAVRQGSPGNHEEVETPALGEVLDFMRMLWAIDHGLQTTSKRMESTLGVTGLQRMVIRLVGRFPGISAGHLARLLHVHPSTLTGVLKRIQDRQLVTRTADPRDARRALFTLTARGRTLDVPTTGTVESAVQRALEKIPQAKINAARDILVALAEELTSQQGSNGSAAPARKAKSASRKS